MTIKTRGTLFYFCVVLCAISSFLMFFYSLGWRFDFGRLKATQPGIFYLKVWPKSVSVYIDGALKKKTDFFFGSGLIENLPAKRYLVELKKDGYFTWSKILDIRQREATEIKNISLIPENPVFSVSVKNISDIFLSEAGEKFIYKEKNGESWSLAIVEANVNSESITPLSNETQIIEIYNKSPKTKLKIDKAELTDITISPDYKRAILKTTLSAKAKNSEKPIEDTAYFLIDPQSAPSVLYLDFADPVAEKLEFNLSDGQKLLAISSPSNTGKNKTASKAKIISEISMAEKKSKLLIDGVIAYSTLNNNVIYIDDKGQLFLSDYIFNQRDRLNTSPYLIKKENYYRLFTFGDNIFLLDNFILYQFNGITKDFDKICESARDIKLSPDKRKLAYFNNFEIKVLYLDKQYDQPVKEKGDKVFISRYSEKITDIFWYNDYYLIFDAGGKIKVAEIDDRDKVNIFDLAEFKDSKIFWNQSNKKLYVLSGDSLYVSDKLAP